MKKPSIPEAAPARSAHSNSTQDDGLTTRSLSRRRLLTATTAAVGAAGAAVASWPFLASWLPSARARSIGGPVQIDVSKIEPGTRVAVIWQGKPVWVVRRTAEMLEGLAHEHLLEHLADPDSDVQAQQPAYARNAGRSVNAEFFVVIAVCTHLGCVPLFQPEFPAERIDDNWMGGFFCPCHKSKFDLAGRVYKAVPAPTNLIVPPHRYLSPDVIEIGFVEERRSA